MKTFMKYSIFFLIPLLALFVVEFIHRSSLTELGAWIANEPQEAVVNYLFYFACFNLFYFTHQKFYLWTSLGLLLLFSVFAFVSRVKTMYRGVPLHPSDFKLIKEAVTVRDYLYTSLDWKWLILAATAIVLFAWGIHRLKMKAPISLKTSTVLLAVNVVLLSSLFSGKPLPIEKWSHIAAYTYTQSKHYDVNGFSLGFLMLTKTKDISDIALDYTKENVLKIKDSITVEQPISDVSPNVLYIMSESFWDPAIIDKLALERDPIPNFRRLKEEYTHGDLVVTIFGGNTGNSEFEALTGMSLWFLGGSHVIPFNDKIEQPVDSMASILTRQGYTATAMHPFNMGYYNRIETYRELGFQNYIPPEYMYNREKRGQYVSDHVLMKQVIDKLERTEEPVFIHAVTMENHGPYDGKKFDKHSISVDGPLSEDNKKYIQDYVEGLTGADASLQYLIDEIERIGEPTVVVFFGDHLPYLGQFEAYKELGFIKDENMEAYEDFMNIHTTPFLIWDNFRENEEREVLRMSSNFLAPYVLGLIGKEGNALTDFLQGLIKEDIIVTPSPPFREYEGITDQVLIPYQLLQMDSLSGEQYSYDEGVVIEQEDYYLGHGVMRVEKVHIRSDHLLVKGEYFVPAAKVYLDGTEVKTKYADPETLIAYLPSGVSGSLKVEVVMIDEWVKDELGRTNSVTVRLAK